MAEKQELTVREKKELVAKEEKTVPGRYYVPYADIYETDEALTVVMEMPGVEKSRPQRRAGERRAQGRRPDRLHEIQGYGAGVRGV